MTDPDEFLAQLAAQTGNRRGGSTRPGEPAGSASAQLLQATAGLGRRLFDAAACSVALLDEDHEHLVFQAASGEGAEQVVGLRLPVARGIAGWVVSSGQPIAVDEVRRDPRFARDVAESTGYVPQSILAAPLDTSEHTLGVIEVLDRAHVAERDDLGLLSLLAHQTALGVQVARSFENLGRAFGGSTPGSPAAGSPDQTSTRQLAQQPPETFAEIAGMFAELTGLGAAEQRAAAGLVRGFLDYVRRSHGPAGLV